MIERTTLPRILLVDDDKNCRLTSAAVLEDEGFAVEIAGSFAEGRLRLSAGHGFDFVILDYNLGDGSGLDLIPLIRAESANTKVILLSGTEVSPSFPALDGVLTKGGDVRELVELLHRLLQEPPPSAR